MTWHHWGGGGSLFWKASFRLKLLLQCKKNAKVFLLHFATWFFFQPGLFCKVLKKTSLTFAFFFVGQSFPSRLSAGRAEMTPNRPANVPAGRQARRLCDWWTVDTVGRPGSAKKAPVNAPEEGSEDKLLWIAHLPLVFVVEAIWCTPCGCGQFLKLFGTLYIQIGLVEDLCENPVMTKHKTH